MTPILKILPISLLLVLNSCVNKDNYLHKLLYQKKSYWLFVEQGDTSDILTGYGLLKNNRCFGYEKVYSNRYKTTEDVMMFWDVNKDILTINEIKYKIAEVNDDTIKLNKLADRLNYLLIKDKDLSCQ